MNTPIINSEEERVVDVMKNPTTSPEVVEATSETKWQVKDIPLWKEKIN